MRWCPTGVMFADGPTKASKQLRDQLRTWLDGPHTQLTAQGASRKEDSTSDNLQFMQAGSWCFIGRFVWVHLLPRVSLAEKERSHRHAMR